MSDPVRSPRMAGNIVKKARLARAWTQSDLADRMNVRQATVSKLERGEPATRLETFFDALTSLGLDVNVSERSSGHGIEDLF